MKDVVKENIKRTVTGAMNEISEIYNISDTEVSNVVRPLFSGTDNTSELEKQLAEKDARIAELERALKCFKPSSSSESRLDSLEERLEEFKSLFEKLVVKADVPEEYEAFIKAAIEAGPSMLLMGIDKIIEKSKPSIEMASDFIKNHQFDEYWGQYVNMGCPLTYEEAKSYWEESNRHTNAALNLIIEHGKGALGAAWEELKEAYRISLKMDLPYLNKFDSFLMKLF